MFARQVVEAAHLDEPACRAFKSGLQPFAVVQLPGRRRRTDDEPDAAARLLALFESLAEGAQTEGGALTIEGRPIALLRAASGMAWFDFAALCEGARSQLDYMEIASELHTVFLTGVPRFGALQDLSLIHI